MAAAAQQRRTYQAWPAIRSRRRRCPASRRRAPGLTPVIGHWAAHLLPPSRRGAGRHPGCLLRPRRRGAGHPRGTGRSPGSPPVARPAGNQEGHHVPQYPGRAPATWGSRRKTTGLDGHRKDPDTSPQPQGHSRSPPQATSPALPHPVIVASRSPCNCHVPGRRHRGPARTTRASLAALIAIKARTPAPADLRRAPPLRGWQGPARGFTEADYAGLLDAAHQQLGGLLVVVWDDLNTHVSAFMRELTAARAWPTVFQLPPYAHGSWRRSSPAPTRT
jgi:hypothetical protein